MKLTIKQNGQSVEIETPYYAVSTDWIRSEYWAITSEEENISVADYGEKVGFSIANQMRSYFIPQDAKQITAAEFAAAYEKAQLAITESFLKACPQQAPKVTIEYDPARALAGEEE